MALMAEQQSLPMTIISGQIDTQVIGSRDVCKVNKKEELNQEMSCVPWGAEEFHNKLTDLHMQQTQSNIIIYFPCLCTPDEC